MKFMLVFWKSAQRKQDEHFEATDIHLAVLQERVKRARKQVEDETERTIRQYQTVNDLI